MTYKELHSEIQSYLRLNRWVEGYSSQQESQAEAPCKGAIEHSKLHDRLLLRKSTGAGRFYDIYARVVGQDVLIGYLGSDGTVKKQAIKCVFFDLDRYGHKEAIWALLDIAKVFFNEKHRITEAAYEEQERQLEALKKEKGKLRNILTRIEEEKDGTPSF